MKTLRFLFILTACIFFFSSDLAYADDILLEEWCLLHSSATWDGITCEFSGTVDLVGSLIIPSEQSLLNDGHIYMGCSHSIINYGTINNQNVIKAYTDPRGCFFGGWIGIVNHGIVDNYGIIESDRRDFDNYGTFHNHGYFHIYTYGFVNSGTLHNSGSISINSEWTGPTISNSGTLHNDGSISINSEQTGPTISNSGTLHNDGSINISAKRDGTVGNDGALENSGIFYNSGNININSKGNFHNGGAFYNSGNINIKINGVFANWGTCYIGGTTINDYSGTFRNLIDGVIYFYGTFINDGQLIDEGTVYYLYSHTQLPLIMSNYYAGRPKQAPLTSPELPVRRPPKQAHKRTDSMQY